MVCKEFNNNIQVGKFNGECVVEFGIIGSDLGELNYLCFMVVFSDGWIVVFDIGNYCIQIFE